MISQAARRFASLLEPLVVTHVVTVLDGGTVCVTLADAVGTPFGLCFDRRMSSQTHGWLYIGATYPNDAQVEVVPLGSELQGEVLGRLRATVAREVAGGLGVDPTLADAIQRLRELTWDAKADL